MTPITITGALTMLSNNGDAARPKRKLTEREKAQRHANYLAHQDERIAQAREYRATHKAEYAAYEASRREQRSAARAAYRAAHPEKDRAVDKRRRERQPDKIKARKAVQHEVRAGRFPRADTMVCEHCGEALAAHWHHHNGYGFEHRLDVIAVCKECHIGTHKEPQ